MQISFTYNQENQTPKIREIQKTWSWLSSKCSSNSNFLALSQNANHSLILEHPLYLLVRRGGGRKGRWGDYPPPLLGNFTWILSTSCSLKRSRLNYIAFAIFFWLQHFWKKTTFFIFPVPYLQKRNQKQVKSIGEYYGLFHLCKLLIARTILHIQSVFTIYIPTKVNTMKFFITLTLPKIAKFYLATSKKLS